MRPIELTRGVFVSVVMVAGQAQAAPVRDFAIPAGSLDQSVRILARQGGIDIGSAEPDLAAARVPALRTRSSAKAALDRLLKDTPFAAVALDDQTYRIVRRPRTAPRLIARVRQTSPRPDPGNTEYGEVVVTASKSRTSLLRYPGSAVILPRDAVNRLGSSPAQGFGETAAALPILQTTSQGPGRDKVFVRGVADSSFAGPTQSTATIYFGDVQLGYNGPDPNLSLYDVGRVEVLEGPQGTLYGSGAIGGIIRLEPRAPDLSRTAGHAMLGASLTQSGDPGYDVAAMMNLPLVRDRLGLRLVAYRAFDGGYIDDIQQRRTNVNDTTTTGGRASLRAVADGWTLDAGIVAQRIHAADLQYAEHGLPDLSRSSRMPQPFLQKYALARLVTTKEWDDGLRLLIASGVVHHDSADRLDATRRSPIPIAYDVRDHSRLLSQEIRISRATPGLRWLGGVSLLRATDRFERTLGPLDQPRDIVGVANRATLAAVFGETTVELSQRLSVTLGARATHARTDGDPISTRRPGPFLRGKTSKRIDPTVAASWLVASDVAVFTKYQSGFRTGGIAVAPGVGRVANFAADTLEVMELGIRKDRSGQLGFAGSATVSISDWDRVQADLIGRNGFPYTANIGSARITGIELAGSWVPVAGLRFSAAVFHDHSRIIDPSPGLAATKGSALPMSPKLSSSAGVDYHWQAGGLTWAADIDFRQVGRSALGTQAPLDLSQRGYQRVSGGAGISLPHGLELTARIENVLNARGDRYASGNSFGILSRDQYTPVRPRTLRLGISIPFQPNSGEQS